jgi:tripartite ATP-independent transporter DctP family solute receptor
MSPKRSQTNTSRWSRRQFLAASAAAVAMPSVARAEPMRLRIGHALPTSHPVHPSMQYFADLVRERTAGAIEMTIFADGLVGQEPELIALAQGGKLDFIKVSATPLERTADTFRIFSLPFLFRDRAHWGAVTANDVGQAILSSAQPAGLLGLTYYDAGARSFYGQRQINHPDDLKDLKIRIQPSPTMKRLMALFGADGIEMPWEQVFPALKNHIVDGAENSVAALIVGKHGEVISHYSFDEHTMVPDVFLVSMARWQTFTPQQQQIIRDAAQASYERMNGLWREFEGKVRGQAEAMGVKFSAPEKAPFIDRAAPLAKDFAGDPAIANLLGRIAQS